LIFRGEPTGKPNNIQSVVEINITDPNYFILNLIDFRAPTAEEFAFHAHEMNADRIHGRVAYRAQWQTGTGL
jgi:hypothetical protein